MKYLSSMFIVYITIWLVTGGYVAYLLFRLHRAREQNHTAQNHTTGTE